MGKRKEELQERRVGNGVGGKRPGRKGEKIAGKGVGREGEKGRRSFRREE
jgi:hypothetical protein